MPERFTQEVVKEKKSCRMVFATQDQQRPAPLEGNMIKRIDVRYFGGIWPTRRKVTRLLRLEADVDRLLF